MTAPLAPLATCARPGCPLPAHYTLAEHGAYVGLCVAHYEQATCHGVVVIGSNGGRYEVVADALDIELSEARREIERLAAQVAEVNAALLGYESGEIAAQTFALIVRMTIFPESVNENDLEYGKRKLAEIKAQGHGAK